jgi:hypothetical protein
MEGWIHTLGTRLCTADVQYATMHLQHEVLLTYLVKDIRLSFGYPSV